MVKPNYEICTLHELEEVLERIDKNKFPERVREVERLIALRIQGVDPVPQHICPKCREELSDSYEWSWKGEVVSGSLFLLNPLVGLIASFASNFCPVLQCTRCGKKFRMSELNKSLNQDADSAGAS